MNNNLLALFNYEYEPEELKARIKKVLSENILLSNTKQLRKFHAQLFSDFEWYRPSKAGEDIDHWPNIAYDGVRIAAYGKEPPMNVILTIQEFCKKVDEVNFPKLEMQFSNGRSVVVYKDGPAKFGNNFYSKEECDKIVKEISKLNK